MGTITKLNDILCANISKVDDVLKANASKWDDNTFCPGGSPTPTPTITPTPTPTPTPACLPGCCRVELCYNDTSCGEACLCTNTVIVYLSIACSTDPCTLGNASGIFDDPSCRTPAAAGYYSDGVDCYNWDGSGTLIFGQPC